MSAWIVIEVKINFANKQCVQHMYKIHMIGFGAHLLTLSAVHGRERILKPTDIMSDWLGEGMEVFRISVPLISLCSTCQREKV